MSAQLMLAGQVAAPEGRRDLRRLAEAADEDARAAPAVRVVIASAATSPTRRPRPSRSSRRR